MHFKALNVLQNPTKYTPKPNQIHTKACCNFDTKVVGHGLMVGIKF